MKASELLAEVADAIGELEDPDVEMIELECDEEAIPSVTKVRIFAEDGVIVKVMEPQQRFGLRARPGLDGTPMVALSEAVAAVERERLLVRQELEADLARIALRAQTDSRVWVLVAGQGRGRPLHYEFFSQRPKTPGVGGDPLSWPESFEVWEGNIDGGDSVLIEQVTTRSVVFAKEGR